MRSWEGPYREKRGFSKRIVRMRKRNGVKLLSIITYIYETVKTFKMEEIQFQIPIPSIKESNILDTLFVYYFL